LFEKEGFYNFLIVKSPVLPVDFQGLAAPEK
jgi:hypothetical protein